MPPENLLHPATLKFLCARAGMRPDRRSGQNFLVNARTLARIVSVVDPQPDEVILEVGAGFGVLTAALAPSGARVIAVERDRAVLPILREQVVRYTNVEVIEGDILALFAARRGSKQEASLRRHFDRASPRVSGEIPFDVGTLHAPWKLAANLPYSITSDFFRLLFDRIADATIAPPERAVFLLQREVVDRLTATPGKRSDARIVGMLTILAQLHAIPRRIAIIPPAHFWPAPSVDSAIIVFEQFRAPEEIAQLLRKTPRDEFLALVRCAFTSRRKQLRSTLIAIDRENPDRKIHLDRWLQESSISPTVRPEELTLGQWIALARTIRAS